MSAVPAPNALPAMLSVDGIHAFYGETQALFGVQLTFPPMKALLPRWSPDGTQIAFNATVPGGNWNVYLVPTEGGTPQHILPSEQSQVDASWSADGNSLVFGTFPTDPRSQIYTIDLSSKRVSVRQTSGVTSM